MKIRQQDYKIIEDIRGGDLNISQDIKEWITKQVFSEELDQLLLKMKSKGVSVRYVAHSTYDHLIKKDFLKGKLVTLVHEVREEYGWLIIFNRAWAYKVFQNDEEYVALFLGSRYGKEIDVGMMATHIKDENNNYHFDVNPSGKKDLENWGQIGIALSALVLPFLQFAETEIKVINAKTNHATKIGGEKYVTDMPIDIEIIDSAWFTEIIRTEGFGVSGHFRLQAYGAGMQLRRLQWISAFEKYGYHKVARKDVI